MLLEPLAPIKDIPGVEFVSIDALSGDGVDHVFSWVMRGGAGGA